LPLGPIESSGIQEEIYNEFKWRIEDLFLTKGIKYSITEYPPTPFETYCRLKFRFSEPTKIRIHYIHPYSIRINDTFLNLIYQLKLFARVDKGPTLTYITFKPRFLLFSKEHLEPLTTEEFLRGIIERPIIVEVSELTVSELWVTISTPTMFSRVLQKFIQEEKFWIEIRTYYFETRLEKAKRIFEESLI